MLHSQPAISIRLFLVVIIGATLGVLRGAWAQAPNPIPDTISRIVITCGDKTGFKKSGLMRAAADGDTYAFQLAGALPPTVYNVTWQYRFGNGDWETIPAEGKTVPNWGTLHPSVDRDSVYSLTWTGAPAGSGTFAIKGHGKRSCPGGGGAGGDVGGVDDFDAIWEGDVASPPVDLVIHNGQGGSAVAEGSDEEEVGAFTVANRNDTDGDGEIDNVDDNGVSVTLNDPNRKGRNEVDLMQLDIDLSLIMRT